jgi:hypothetical protein
MYEQERLRKFQILQQEQEAAQQAEQERLALATAIPVSSRGWGNGAGSPVASKPEADLQQVMREEQRLLIPFFLPFSSPPPSPPSPSPFLTFDEVS